MKSGFFQQLRTEQQLGYIVSAFSWAQRDVPALVMLVQSPSTDARVVAKAMEGFLQAVEGEMDAAKFERHKAALISHVMQPDKNMWERAEFYWQSIAKRQTSFDGRQALADALDDLTLDTWLEYYNRVFINHRHSLQVVAPGKWDEVPDSGATVFIAPAQVKQDHVVYSIH